MRLRLPFIDLFRKSGLLLTFLSAIALTANAQGLFTPVASAVNTGGNCYRLTTETVSDRGAIWHNTKISLLSDFDITFTFNFGTRSGYSGGDGMAFVLQPAGLSQIGVAGSAKGWGNNYDGNGNITTPGISPSVVVDYDNYDDNGGTDALLSLLFNGDYRGTNPANVGVPQSSIGFVNDGQEHTQRIIWHAATKTLSVHTDGVLRFAYIRDFVNDIFSGQDEVYFGFTAATGGSVNQYSVCYNAELSTFSPVLIPTLGQVLDACAGGSTGSATINLQGGANPFIIELNGVSHVFTQSNITSSSVTFSNLPADVYSVRILESNGYVNNDLSFTIHDNPTPFITASGPLTFCQGGSVVLTASSGTSYLWNTGETTPSITVTNSGNYTVTITNGSCVSTSPPFEILVNPSPATPTLALSGPTEFCEGGSVVISVTNVEGVAYQWLKSVDGGYADPIPGETASSITVTTTGRYTVMATNGCGTIASGTYEITVNAPPLKPTISASGSLVLCSYNSVVLTSSSATGNTWSNGATTQSITVTPATVGSYSVNVSNGSCSTNSDMTMVVNAPAFVSSITASGPTLICTGSSVTYTLNEPVPSVSRTWYRYADGAYDPTFNETGLSIVVTKSGNYGVNIIDSYGCFSNPPGSHDVTVLPPPTKPLAFTVSGSGECTTNAGSVAATIDLSSGVAPINMTWDDGNGFITNAQSLNNVPAGIYTATVYDYCGTTVVKTFTVTGPVTPATISATATNVCAGNTSTLSVNNIDALLTYQWYVNGNPIIGATGTSYEASTAGNYQVLASNGGCSAYSNGISITISSPLTVNIISNETSCLNGGGYAFASPVGGAAPVSFEGWTGPNGYTSNNPNISSLLVGTYTASYRDGCGNLASASVTINAATPVILPSITASKPYCVNGEDVVLTLGPTSYSFAWVEYDASNATQPYNWAFSPNQYSITVNKPGMQYYVVHTDANNCNSFSQGANFFTTLPSPISFSVTSSPSCGTNTGTAQIYNITGGKSPVTYSWTDGASFSSTNGFISNLSPGTYTVTAIDACSSAVSQSVTITGQITAATITTTTQNICSGSSAVLSVANFNAAYSYQWIREGVIIPGATGASYSATLQGFYYVRVSDGVCSADANGIYIAVVAAPSLSVYATPSCGSSNAGSAYIQSVSGGLLPFTYAWTDGNTFSSNSQVLNNLAAGNYTVTVTDACGAQDSKSVIINQLPAVIGTISGLPAICTEGGSTTLTASTNGTPATYAWHKTIAGVTTYDIASTPAISASEAGHYWVTIRDVNGCFSTPGVTVTAAGAPLTITVTGTVSCGPSSGSARVVYSGGTAPITVAWTNGGTFSSTSTQITQLAPGTYTATVTEGCGASIAQSFTVIAGQVTSTTVSKSGPTTICSGDAVTLSAVYNSVVPAASYRWSRFDDGIMVNNYATAQSINVTEGGTYQVFVTNAYGCISSSPITDVFVTIPRTPTVVADGLVNLCPEGSVNLTATSNSNQSKYSLQFNGSNYVEAPHQSYMGLTKRLTVEAWFKTDDAGTVQYIVSKGIDDYTPGQYGLVLVNSKVEFHLFMNGIHQAVQSTTSIENGKWYHAAGTWDSTKIIMYVNGVAEGQRVFVGPMTANTEPLQIGRLGKPGALYNFKGEIDEVRIWNTALTEAQINTAKGLIVNYSNTMVANYRFEAGMGTTVADNGYGNPATMIGSPQWTVSTAPFYNYTPTYLWSPGGATTSTLNVNTAGSYTVTVNAGGCTNTSDPIIITSLPVTTITASGSLTLLPGQTVTLTASAGTSYVWSNGATTPSIVVGTAEVGTYTVTVTNNGCTTTSAPTVVSAAAAIAPVINVPAAISVNNDPGTCGAIVNFTATETTGVPASTITYSHASGSLFPIGTTTVTVTATNSVGVSTGTFNVTVIDNEKPIFVITAPGTATVTIPAMQTFVGDCTMIPFNFLDPLPAGAVVTGIDLTYSGQDQGWGYTGGNDDLYVSGTKVASSVYAHETKTFNTSYTGPIPGYVYGGNNVFGFVFTCYPGWQGFINGGTMTIRYTSSFGPKTVNSDAGKCDATLPLTAPNASDNCGAAAVTNDAPATFPVGTTNVTWTATDTHGNTNTITQAITVIDNQVPVITTQNITVALTNGTVSITPAQVNNGSTDNCGIASYSLDKTSFDCSNLGTNTVTLTVTDIHGNSATATANVIVNSGGTQATITAGGPTTICTGSSVTLTASAGTGYLWSTGETTQSITVSISGSYTVTVSGSSDCPSTSVPTVVTVNPVSTLTITPANPVVCSGSTLILNSTITGGTVATPIVSSLSAGGQASAKLVVGLRKLVSIYTGPAIRLRRSSDNAESDFGFSGNELDLTAINSFLGGSTGFVTTLYDQSGNGGNITQPNAGIQPTFVANGLNGKPNMHMSSSQYMTNSVNYPSPFTVVYAAKQTGPTRGRMLTSVSNNWLLGWWAVLKGLSFFEGWVEPSGGGVSSNGDTNPYVYTGSSNGSNSSFLYQNGTLLANNAGGITGPNGISLNRSGPYGEPSDGDFTEVFIFNTVLSTDDRQLVENSAASYYSIYAPLSSVAGPSLTVNPTTTTAYTINAIDVNGCAVANSITVTVSPSPIVNITAGGPTSFCAGGSVALTVSNGNGNGNALAFNGANRVTVSNTPSIPVGNSSYTIEAWIKPKTISGANGIIGWGNWGAINQVNAIRFNGPTTLVNYWWSNDLYVTIPNVLDGKWHHIAATFNGTTRSLYMDGILLGSDTPSGHNVPSGTPMYIAETNPTSNEYFDGAIDEVRIWNIGKSQAQISATMNITVPANSAGLVAYYNMDEGAGVTTADATDNGNTGVLTGNPVWNVPSTSPVIDNFQSISWSAGGETTNSITVTTSGTYSATVTNAAGCSVTSSPITVTVNAAIPATISANGPTTFCAGGSVTLTASAGASYLWSNGSTSPSITVNQPGDYSVTVTSGSGCSSVSAITTVAVYTNVLTTISASGPTTFCSGGSVTLTSSAATGNVWSTGETTQSITVSQSGNYSVTATDGNGCSAMSTNTTVTVNTSPVATITSGGPTSFCSGGSVTLTSSAATGNVWSTGETSQSITVSQSGNYTVTVTDASGCATVSASTNVTVNTAPVVNPMVIASGPTTLCGGGTLGLSVSAMGGNSLRFNGSNYLEAPSAPGNSLSTAFTAELWFKTDNAAATQYLVSKGKSDGAPGQYGLVLVNSRVQLHLGGAGSASINSVTLLQSNTWYHVAGTWDGATGIARLYLNGSYEGQVTTGTNSNLGTNVEPLQIGRLGLSCCPYMFSGEMDEIRIWNVARDAGQIANGRSLSFGNTPNLVANYHFDEGTGAVTYDSAPGGSNATLVNSPTWQVSGAPVNAPNSSYLWSNGETTPNINVNTAGTYTATVTYITTDGCTATGTSAPVSVTNVPAATVTASGPVTFCPGGSVVLTASAGTAYSWNTGETTQSITVTQSGNYTVSVTNGLGCTTVSTSVAVSVTDITPPVPDLPSLPVINITPNGLITAPTATDDCSGVSVTGTTTDQVTNLLSGTYTITWNYVDASGNTSTQTQTVIVEDVAPPSLKAMNRIVKNNDPGVCGAMVTYVMPVANDNASTTKVTINEGGGDGVITFNTPLSQNVTSLDFISSGEYQDIVHGHGVDIAIQVELFNPQSGSWTLVQTVQTGTTDYHFGGTAVHFPAISQVSQIRFTASQPVYAAFHFYEMSVNLNSIAAVQTAGLPSGSVFPIGRTLNTFRAVDFSGNEAFTSFEVEVLDAEKPKMANYASTTHPAGATGTWTGSAATIAISDNCGSETLQLTEEYFDQRGNRFYQGQSSVAQGNLVLSNRTFPVGTNTVVVSIRDGAGNISDRARFNVSITDITPPVIVISGNMTQTADPGVCAAWVKVPIPVTSDNCSVQAVANSFNGSPSAAGRYPVGTTIVTWTVTDGSGNKTTAVQTITVIDNEPPVLINVPMSMIQTNDAGSCGAVVSWDAVRATDNCGLISFVSNHQSGENFPIGETVVTFTATDRNGNIGTSSFTITVKDNEAPKVITRPITITLVNGSATILPSAINNGSSDNCGAVTIAASKTVFTCADVGINRVTLTVTDVNNNTSSGIALVTVIGETPTSRITVIPSNSTYTGGVPTDIYLGYGPQSVTLSTTVTGTVPVSYNWTGSSGLSCTTCANPVFTPTAAGSYRFTVVATNIYGCTTTSSVTICVRDIRVPSSNGRVYVCHTDLGTGTITTVDMATNTVANYLLQNPQDKLGSCGMAPCSQVIVTATPDVPKTITPEIVEKMSKESSVTAITGLSVKASPNPTNDVFTFIITSAGKQPVHIRLLNEAGKMEESRSNIQLGSAFTMGRSLHSGVYFAEVIQGKERVVVKLIKMVR